MHYTYIVEYFLLYIIESIDTREVCRLLRRLYRLLIKFNAGEQAEDCLHRMEQMDLVLILVWEVILQVI